MFGSSAEGVCSWNWCIDACISYSKGYQHDGCMCRILCAIARSSAHGSCAAGLQRNVMHTSSGG